MQKYNPSKIEKKWQKAWDKNKVFEASDTSLKEKKYILVEFPYPSGEGLHAGHPRPYTAGDITARYTRARGYEVMFPYGWDAFGLPAENYAIKNGIQPDFSTKRNIKNFKRQVKSIGLSFDWSREINTTDPNYYKWTQWIFLQLFKNGLAYEATAPINWCPKDKTGLANEEVIDGKCERCGTPVEKKMLRQWYLRITSYAQKLLDGLETLKWPAPIKIQQQNWIGKSEGAEIEFKVESKNFNAKVVVFTTRPDTLFGVTYLVLAPEYASIDAMKKDITNWKEVEKYIKTTAHKTDLQRSAMDKEKTGVELKGITAINPANKKRIPVWIADYVLASYGTGAIMAVPAHDLRDEEFAKKFELPIIKVIDKNGTLVHSGKYDGFSILQAAKKITTEFGKVKVQFKLRDWVFSRQRYWGEPIPLIHCPKDGIVEVPEKDLPVVLPKVERYEPTGTGESPLATIASWVNVKCPKCGGPAKRETNTMPQWAGSSWYFLRYTDPQNKTSFANLQKMQHWMPVDLYFGGMEHTTLHLLYSRFWNQFLFDKGYVPVSEPYTMRQPHGLILAGDGEKMSKSRGNVVNPDDIIKKFGADTLRMYTMFLGPYEQAVTWNVQGLVGVRRFLDRVWNLVSTNANIKPAVFASEKAEVELSKLIKKVGEDIESFKFNTAVSSFMEFINNISGEVFSKDLLQKFVLVLSPFAPHIAEELWNMLGGEGLVAVQAWPKYDQSKLQSSTVQFVVQVNGKFRGNLQMPKDAVQNDVDAKAKVMPTVIAALGKNQVKKVIFVVNRLINFVV